MTDQEKKALEAAAMIYNTLPNYLYKREDRKTLNLLILELIDALDIIEYEESGEPFFSIFKGVPQSESFQKKQAVMRIAEKYNLTKREMQLLSYLRNRRSTTYIAESLNIAKATAKAHKYSIYKKLGVHTSKELIDLIKQYE